MDGESTVKLNPFHKFYLDKRAVKRCNPALCTLYGKTVHLDNIFSRADRKRRRQIRSLQMKADGAVAKRLNFAGFTKKDRDIVSFVLAKHMTMVGGRDLIGTCAACKYVVQNNISGDFVECGVWRGGNAIAAKMIFESYGSDKKVWLFDTFTGMTAPTKADFSLATREAAMPKFLANRTDTHNEWCYASLQDVKNNFIVANVDMANVRFVAGDVLKTLGDKTNLPRKIAVCRLDTDFYASSKYEMKILYPLLVANGVLLVDDYDNWAGQRKAIDEYFEEVGISRPILHRIGGNRVVIK